VLWGHGQGNGGYERNGKGKKREGIEKGMSGENNAKPGGRKGGR
jgi:hypothetical protein